MSWKTHIEELRARERLAEQMGGEERVSRQRSQGKLTVRERIAFLADPGSFHEVGKIAGKAGYGTDDSLNEFLPATMVFGRATLDGRPAVILGDDFTVRGGASDASIAGKMLMAEQMAHEYGMPIVRMVDGTGGGGSVKSLARCRSRAHRLTRFSSSILTTCLACCSPGRLPSCRETLRR